MKYLHSQQALLWFTFMICGMLPMQILLGQEHANRTAVTVVPTAEVKWDQLNPKRGKASPMAANLWGDRNKAGMTGFLVKFVDGFQSPPHIHNVTYRGVVIAGRIHNDDPDAEPMWMPAGSYWTQPAGEVHITAGSGKEIIAYIEIERGPYLVLPKEKQFYNGERPVNVDAGNLVWLGAADTSWVTSSTEPKHKTGPQISFLWGKPHLGELNGTLLKLPHGFSGVIQHRQSTLQAVVIEGTPKLTIDEGTTDIAPGSYFSFPEKIPHTISCNDESGCLIYLRCDGKYSVTY